MFLDKKRPSTTPGTFEAWLWRRWQSTWPVWALSSVCLSFIQTLIRANDVFSSLVIFDKILQVFAVPFRPLILRSDTRLVRIPDVWRWSNVEFAVKHI